MVQNLIICHLHKANYIDQTMITEGFPHLHRFLKFIFVLLNYFLSSISEKISLHLHRSPANLNECHENALVLVSEKYYENVIGFHFQRL